MAYYITFVVSTLYVWFLIPLGLPKIAFWHMYGIILFISLLTRQVYIPKEKSNLLQIIGGLCGPAMALLLGYIIKSFLM